MAFEGSTRPWQQSCRIFFGTPHFGADKNQWLSIAKALGKVSSKAKGEPSTLVEAMTQNSRGLVDISEDFVHVAPNYAIKTVYETKKMKSTGQLVVPMMSTRMFGLQQEEMPIDADHLSMCQFSDKDDPGFEIVCSFIRKAIKKVPEPRVSEWPIQMDQTPKTQVGNILGRPIYIDTPPMHQGSVNPTRNTRSDMNELPSILSSHERPLLPAPESRNLDTKAQPVTIPLALPAPTPQTLRLDMAVPRVLPIEWESEDAVKLLQKDIPVPRVVSVECESEKVVKQSRWSHFSRRMGGRIWYKG
ncbi:hypothetical protein F5144DRAFT_590568 [Chaetomium tenue]|uniref:Uncharacterized protein n=1 Tax=Chaetomium tenue TaxID=1854479 RepID=A0ACB7PLH9_9PEZI|nr:hypothetical protein F5144DRAFT_590568 [Chaetomium globosum]